MKNFFAMMAALGLSVSAAHAATIYTPPLSVENSGEHICRVVNVSSKAREVTIDILDPVGTVIDSTTATLGPGATHFNANTTDARRYCRVTVKGSKNTVRVSFESRINGDTVAAVNGF